MRRGNRRSGASVPKAAARQIDVSWLGSGEEMFGPRQLRLEFGRGLEIDPFSAAVERRRGLVATSTKLTRIGFARSTSAPPGSGFARRARARQGCRAHGRAHARE